MAYQNKIDNQNYEAWLHGRYVLESIAACFGKNSKYPKQPYGKEKAEDNVGEQISDADRFKAFANQYNMEKFGK